MKEGKEWSEENHWTMNSESPLHHTESHWITHKWYMFWDPLHMSNMFHMSNMSNSALELRCSRWKCLAVLPPWAVRVLAQKALSSRSKWDPNPYQVPRHALELGTGFHHFPPWNDTEMLWLVLTILWLVNLGWWFMIFHGPDSWWVLPFCESCTVADMESLCDIIGHQQIVTGLKTNFDWWYVIYRGIIFCLCSFRTNCQLISADFHLLHWFSVASASQGSSSTSTNAAVPHLPRTPSIFRDVEGRLHFSCLLGSYDFVSNLFQFVLFQSFRISNLNLFISVYNISYLFHV